MVRFTPSSGLMHLSCLLASASAEITFTYQRATALVEDNLRDPNVPIQFRNIDSTVRSCYASFNNGHSAGGNLATNEFIIPDRGIILSTGHPFAFSENDTGETTARYGEETGEPELESQLPKSAGVFDSCYIQFDFRCPPSTPTVVLDYVFGSEEYHDGDGEEHSKNDAFGVFLNGENIALVPDGTAPVSVNNINSKTNSEYFIENELSGRINLTSPFPGIEADGFTTKLRASAESLQGWNTIKLVIGDVGDGNLDSWVLLEAGSLSCVATKKTSSLRTPPPIFSRDDGSEWAFKMSRPVAIGTAVMVGVVALMLPIASLVLYRKKRVAPAK